MSTVTLLAGLTTGTLAYYLGLGWLRAQRALAARADCHLTAPPPTARADCGDTRDFERPYEPTAEDWAEYSRWSDALAGAGHEAFCPADFGHYCEDCDREMAEAAAAQLAEGDGWYLDLVARALTGRSGGAADWRAGQ